jgi:hypothetical protein
MYVCAHVPVHGKICMLFQRTTFNFLSRTEYSTDNFKTYFLCQRLSAVIIPRVTFNKLFPRWSSMDNFEGLIFDPFSGPNQLYFTAHLTVLANSYLAVLIAGPPQLHPSSYLQYVVLYTSDILGQRFNTVDRKFFSPTYN